MATNHRITCHPCRSAGRHNPAGPRAITLHAIPDQQIPPHLTPICPDCLKTLQQLDADHPAEATAPEPEPITDLIFDRSIPGLPPARRGFRIHPLPIPRPLAKCRGGQSRPLRPPRQQQERNNAKQR